MTRSVRTGRDVRSPLATVCVLEPLEGRQLLATTVPNIMPLGDSITESSTGHASYRYWLWNSLADAGYTVDIVGSEQPPGVVGGPPLYPGFDPQHEGHSGFTADGIRTFTASSNFKVYTVRPQNRPDIVLLHLGTNDVLAGQSDASTRDELGKIIDDLRAINPNVTVLLAQIIPNTTASVSGLNSLLPALAASKNTAQSRVVVVDQASGFDAAADTYDGLHPDESGEKKIAAKFFAAMTPFLPAPTPPPEGVYLDDSRKIPLTSATNAFGPAEHNTSNGDFPELDGTPLTIEGQTFMRGFGVNGPSELEFDLSGGTYTRFRAVVGIDDEIGDVGSVEFQVFVNNETTPRFSSQRLTGADGPVPVNVDITGATSLRLVVTDGGDGYPGDHADWALARVVPAAPEPQPEPEPEPEPEPQPPPAETGNAPSAPEKLVAKFAGHKVKLRWKDTSDNELGFRIERKVGDGAWEQIAELAANVRKYVDTDVTSGARYSYRVVAHNADGTSNASNAVDLAIPLKGKKDREPKADDDQGESEQNEKRERKKKEKEKEKKNKSRNDNGAEDDQKEASKALEKAAKAVKKALKHK